MMSVPHIDIKREGSTWNGWCVNYQGFGNAKLEKVTHCKAGVEYASVETKVDFTYSYDEGHKYNSSTAHPCFKREHHLTSGCASCRFPTPEEIKAHDEECMGDIRRMVQARTAIVADLERRHKEGDKTVTLNPCSQSEYDEGDGPTNYVSGSGLIDCPVCKTGKLGYSRAGYNGRIHARCSTDQCVAWME